MTLDFTVHDQSGKPWRLSDHHDAAAVIMFHRGDFWTYCHGQLAVMAQRHPEFLDAGARLFSISTDTPQMLAAVVEKLALPFPMLSDPDRDQAITPLGFADEHDPRQISRPGTVIMAPGGEIVFSVTGKDYADRPDEDDLLAQVTELGLASTTQGPPDAGIPVAGDNAIALDGVKRYLSGAKFAVLALRRRHRDVGEDFRADTKRYVQMVERYLAACDAVEERRG